MRTRTLPAPSDLLAEAADAVLRCGVLLRAEFHRPGGPRGKHGHAPVDKEIEHILKTRLLGLHACGWRGEELPRQPAPSPDVWVVDPQDGAGAFLKGLRGSAVSVALVRRGEPVLGVVYAPTAPDDRGDFFAWAEGLPATRNGQVLRPLGEARFGEDRGARRSRDAEDAEPRPAPILAFNQNAGDYARANHGRVFPARILAVPSIAYRLALAAAGEVDAGVSLTAGLDPYDIAGGHALLRGVGGALVELDGAAIDYRAWRTFRGCIGGSPDTVAEMARRGLGAPAKREARHPAAPKRRCASAATLSRAQGALLGLLAGDALGSAVEFSSAATIRERHPEGVRELLDGGFHGTLAGQPTDDGEMALALARRLVADGRFDAASVGKAYVAWAESRPFDIGITTRAGIAALTGAGRANAASESNGALMRIAPVGVFAAGRPALAARLAAQDAALTHPSPVCAGASAAFAAAVAAGVGGADPGAMLAVAVAHAGEGEAAARIRDLLLAAMDAPPARCDSGNIGDVAIALANAFHRLHRRQDFEVALVETVAAGGDTDTNAAVAGALLGAAQGREAIPLRWRRAVLSCRPVTAPGVRRARPAAFWPDDALDLAEALLAAGAAYSVTLVWPPSSRMFCPTMKPAWAEHRKAQAAPNSSIVP
jgi:ADP-ribosylglycohydrolase/fructose-1,6-bisphosphatase/inositol monophosphatase family enzyme